MSISPVKRRITQSCSIILFSAVILWANDLNTGGQKGIVRTLSTETLGKTGVNIGGAFKYATEMEYISGPNRSTSVINTRTDRAVDRSTPHLFSGNIFAAYGLTSFWDVGIDLPLYYDLPGWNNEHRSGIGDLELTTKMAYPYGRDDAWLTNAYSLKVLLPTGSTDRGFFARHVYYLTSDNMNDTNAVFSVKTVYFNPQMIWSFDFSRLNGGPPLLLHANFGGVIATQKSNSAVVAAIGLEFRPHEAVTFFTEMSGESRVKWYTNAFKITDFINDPFRVTPGMKINWKNGLYLTLAGDIGVSKKSTRFNTTFLRRGYAYSTKALPRYGAQLTLGWEVKSDKPDRDRDGIPDSNDECKSNAEDIDGFQDNDGCPDLDNDNDGVIDMSDSCPLEPAVCSGCPVIDKDNDKIYDDVDKCINEPEDFDGFKDVDGCPDLDNDNDGIYDANDKCPNNTEDMDGFEDSDGCPDLDNDGDGIPDVDDKCPGVKGVPENNGCPKTEEIKGKLILEGVNFESGKAILTATSYNVLDRVYESLREWENVMVEIRGHTDNQGNDEYNKQLSQTRAETVMQYFINKGIKSDRLRAIGFGESSPIADNRTAAGRAQNRRVELQRVDW
jgi:outer membrane protein OmpA-like peptidoglycan-associated protein